jgi:hypothetical protein
VIGLPLRRAYFDGGIFGGTSFLNARSNVSPVSSASARRAASMNLCFWVRLRDGFALGFCFLGIRGATSCAIGQTLANDAAPSIS